MDCSSSRRHRQRHLRTRGVELRQHNVFSAQSGIGTIQPRIGLSPTFGQTSRAKGEWSGPTRVVRTRSRVGPFPWIAETTPSNLLSAVESSLGPFRPLLLTRSRRRSPSYFFRINPISRATRFTDPVCRPRAAAIADAPTRRRAMAESFFRSASVHSFGFDDFISEIIEKASRNRYWEICGWRLLTD